MDGTDMLDPAQMGALVADLKPGAQATVTVWRDAKPKVIALKQVAAGAQKRGEALRGD